MDGMAGRILVVEDNPVTRKLFRVTLQSAGYEVVEADSGGAAVQRAAEHRPDLILLDLLLPDADGINLAPRLCTQGDRDAIPIIACSGYLAGLEQARASQAGFVDFLFKPVEPSRLLEIVRTHLTPAKPAAEERYAGRRILVADDNPIERKLLKLHLEQLGFTVATAEDGADALDQARRDPPDAIITDVLMPGLDGFRLCLEVRSDPRLSSTPVILSSFVYTEESDRQLGESAGANAFVLRTPNHGGEIGALLACLDQAPAAAPRLPAECDVEVYTHRLIQQLERHASVNVGLTRRLASAEAQLSILAELGLSLAVDLDMGTLTRDVLHRCLDASAVSKGAAYWLEPDGRLVLAAQVGFPEREAGSLRDLFGHAALLREAIKTQSSRVMKGAAAGSGVAPGLPEGPGGGSLLAVPLMGHRSVLGAFLLVFDRDEIEQEQISFAQAMAGYVGQAMELSRALTGLQETNEKLQAVIESSPLAIYVLDPKGRVQTWNPAAERMFGWSAEEVIGRVNPALPPEASEDVLRRRTEVLGGKVFSGVEEQRVRKDGSRLDVNVSVALLHDVGSDIAGMIAVASDITEWKQAQLERQQLIEQLGKLEAQREIERLKGDFVSIVSHEFRTPLASILGFSELLLADGRVEEKQREWITIIRSEGNRLASLVTDVLDASRLEGGRIEARLQPVRAQDAVRRVLSALKGQSLVHRFVCDYPDNLPPVVADPDQLVQVLTNLVSNAVKYSPGGGTVTITAASGGDRVCLSVSDEGLGIPPEELPKLFGRFHRIRTPERTMIPGTGLGLYITKHLVELQGGEIWVESPGVGMGTTFHVQLRQAPA